MSIPAASAREEPVSYLQVLHNRNFSLLWVGQIISFLGDRAHLIALPVLVWNLTGSAVLVSLIYASIGLPWIFLGPVAGTLVDRWDRRRTMIVADLARAGLVLLIPWLAPLNISFVYVLALLVTVFSLFFTPARLAVLPDIVRQRELYAANSLLEISRYLIDFIGYLAGGILVVLLGTTLAFFVDSLSYVISAAVIFSMTLTQASRPSTIPTVAQLLQEFRAGVTFLRGNRYLAANTLFFLPMPLAAGATTAIVPVYALGILEGGTLGAWGFALMEAFLGLGAILGSILVGRSLGGHYRKGRIILAGFGIFSLAKFFLGFVDRLPLALSAVSLDGFGNMLFYIPSVTLVQELTPSEFRARIFSIRQALIQIGLTISAVLAGRAAELIGVQTVILLAGMLVLAFTVAGYFVPSLRDAP
ncbi:MAG: MFS transporter [Chloroflexi bacterium]|nr:MFS transporter [Chloroflexota bacterium]